MNSAIPKIPFLIFYTSNLFYTLLNLRPSKSIIRLNLELMPAQLFYKTSPPQRIFIILPKNSYTKIIINNFNKFDIKTASLPSKTIRDFVHSNIQHKIVSDNAVYYIPFKNCKLNILLKRLGNFTFAWKNTKESLELVT